MMPAKENNSVELKLETISELELVLTNSAIGYEYARLELDRAGVWGFSVDKLTSEIEGYKKSYFAARTKLQTIDNQRLCSLEKSLKEQKMVMFAASSYLH